MQTAQEFMECYLREKGELRQMARPRYALLEEKFYAKDYLKRKQDWHSANVNDALEEFEIAEVFDTSATVITTDYSGKNRHRQRYHLRVTEGKWEIHEFERECFVCKGSGLAGQNACQICKGSGWMNPLRSIG